MQRQLSATNIVTLIFVMAAGVMLSAQLHLAGMDEWLGIPSWILWVGEISAYVAAILIWSPSQSAKILVPGVIVMLLLRIGITAGAALVSTFTNPGETFSVVFSKCLSEVLPYSCSVVFAIMAAYPLRCLLPKNLSGTNSKSGAGDAAAGQTKASSGQTGSNFLFGNQKPSSLNRNSGNDADGGPGSSHEAMELPDHLKDHQIAIPLRVVFPQIPAGVLKAELADEVLDEKMEFNVPLRMIAHQLKEALVQISAEVLVAMLPKAWLDKPAAGMDEKIVLPLEVVIPQVPEELFELGEPSAPAWASFDKEDEKVLFAQV